MQANDVINYTFPFSYQKVAQLVYIKLFSEEKITLYLDFRVQWPCDIFQLSIIYVSDGVKFSERGVEYSQKKGYFFFSTQSIISG